MHVHFCINSNTIPSMNTIIAFQALNKPVLKTCNSKLIEKLVKYLPVDIFVIYFYTQGMLKNI